MVFQRVWRRGCALGFLVLPRRADQHSRSWSQARFARTHRPVPACAACLGPRPLLRRRGWARVRLGHLPPLACLWCSCSVIRQLLLQGTPALLGAPGQPEVTARPSKPSWRRLQAASGDCCAPVASCLGEGERLWSPQKERREEDPSLPAPNQSGPQPALGSARENFWVLQAQFSHLSWI